MAKFTRKPQYKMTFNGQEFFPTSVEAVYEMNNMPRYKIDGFMHEPVNMYANDSVTFNTGSLSISAGSIVGAKIKTKGMNVDIKTVETMDGIKGQIAFNVEGKTVIAWESKAFEDSEDKTAVQLAKEAAQAHAKRVLQKVFKADPFDPSDVPF